VVMATALLTPFLLSLGFTMTAIGVVTKWLGMISTIMGTLIGGALVTKMGIKASLWVFGIFQSLSILTFYILSKIGLNYPALVAAIGLENLCGGMGTAAYTAFLMSLCDRRFTATQYALLTSLMAITRVVVGAPTGFLAGSFGWSNFFIISALAAIPGLLLLLRYDHWSVSGTVAR
ncbi:MAG: hypothetical protein FWH25_02510, partial [Syntrophorhabdaceae bacterium]|nr:hypothetical protein [Syntrophorhabdaceae bacterium]